MLITDYFHRIDNHPIAFRSIPSQHKHSLSEENIAEHPAPDLETVLDEILSLLPS